MPVAFRGVSAFADGVSNGFKSRAYYWFSGSFSAVVGIGWALTLHARTSSNLMLSHPSTMVSRCPWRCSEPIGDVLNSPLNHLHNILYSNIRIQVPNMARGRLTWALVPQSAIISGLRGCRSCRRRAQSARMPSDPCGALVLMHQASTH